jgi:hypothetical protein
MKISFWIEFGAANEDLGQATTFTPKRRNVTAGTDDTVSTADAMPAAAAGLRT